MIKVSNLYCYPIKSCAGTQLKTAALTRCGFANDRALMLTRLDGEFLTQREFPRLCLVRPSVVGGRYTVTAPGMAELSFELRRSGDATYASIWRDRVRVVIQEDEVNDWFSEFLKARVQLVAMSEGFERKIDHNFAVGPTDVVSLADGFSILVISEASLEFLNRKLDTPVGMERFRPNVVVTGCDAHEEDTWKEFTIGGIRMSGVKPCARCSIVTIEQSNGEPGKQSLAALADYRRFANGVMFGMNLVHHSPSGTISVGDAIKVVSRHDPDWVGRERFQ